MLPYLRFPSPETGTRTSPVVCIGPAGTWPHWWQGVAATCPELVVHAAVLPGRATRLDDEPLRDVDAMAADVRGWSDRLLDGGDPVHVAGVCGGALVAHALASAMAADGVPPSSLHLFSTPTVNDLHGTDVSDEAVLASMVSEGSIPAEVVADPDFLDLYSPAIFGDHRAAARFDVERLRTLPAGVAVHLHHPSDRPRHPFDEAWTRAGATLHTMPASAAEVVLEPAVPVGDGLRSGLPTLRV